MNKPFVSVQQLPFALASLVALLGLGLVAPAMGQATNATTSLNYDSFRIITDRNIFNPHRYGRSTSSGSDRPRSYTRADSFALVGTMAYEKGLFAFFEGSNSEYRKVLKQDETIAGFKVADIQPAYVRLASPTNQLELRVGMQLLHSDDGTWQLGAHLETSAGTVASSSGAVSSATVGGGRRLPVTNAQSASVAGDVPSEAMSAGLDGVSPGSQVEPLPPPAATEAAPPAAPGSDNDVIERLRRRAAAERGENP